MMTTPHRSKGLTLVEILITLLVISIGLLGVAGLHAFSMRNNYDALVRSHASALVADISDRMRANRDNAASYVVALGENRVLDADSTLADEDIAAWKATLSAQLPSGDGAIAFDATSSIVRITIRWGERGSTLQAADDNVTFTTETEV